MNVFSSAILMFALLVTAPVYADVVVSNPTNGQTVSPDVQFVATATTSTCSKGVAALGIYVDNALNYQVNGTNLNTNLHLVSGPHRVVVVGWDYCGSATIAQVNLTVSGTAGVSVISPANGSTVGSPVAFSATATSSCPQGVAAMGVYVNNQLAYVANGASLNTQLSLGAGAQNTVVQEWDHCGGSTTAPVQLNVGGTTISDVQAKSGWNQWGELPPVYDICSGSCPGVTWSMNQHVSSVSLTGNATQFNIGGTTPYSDVLWSNPIIGQGNTENLTDSDHKLLPTLHNFVLDSYVFVTKLSVTQIIELDINMFANGVGMEWGTQCNHLGGGAWDIWDNVNAKWVPTSAPCNLNDNGWNHITIQVQRQPNNDLLYQTITVNGVTYNINKIMAPFPVPSGWWGMTINYQMDGDYKQSPNTTYMDKTSFTYW